MIRCELHGSHVIEKHNNSMNGSSCEQISQQVDELFSQLVLAFGLSTQNLNKSHLLMSDSLSHHFVFSFIS